MSKKKNSNRTKSEDKPKIIEEDGMRISYSKSEIEDYFPHIIEEIENKSAKVEIEGIRHKQNEIENQKEETKQKQFSLPEELINPGPVDFIRRCSNVKDALEILEYLKKREEISLDDYEILKEKCANDQKLKNFIKENGGFKKPGYYEKKYYSKQLNS